MMAFGRNWSYRDIPGLFLFLALPAALVIREDNIIFWNSGSVRIITIAISLIFCSILMPLLKQSPLEYISKRMLLIISVFIFSAVFSNILSEYPLRGVARLTEIISLALFALHLRAAIVEKIISPIVISLGMTIVLLVITFGIVDYWNLLPRPEEHLWHEKLPFFSNIRHLGYILAILSPLGFIFWEQRSLKYKVLAVFFSCLCWSMLIWSGGRGAVLSATVVIVIYSVIRPRSLVWIIPTLIISGVVAEHYLINHPSMDLFRSFRSLNQDQIIDLNSISANRITIYTETLKIWWQHGFWFGLGPDSFRFLNPPVVSATFVHPHSMIVQVLIHYGAIGTALLASIVILFFRNLAIQYKSTNLVLALPIISALINGSTDGIFYHAISLFFFICLVVASFPLQQSSKLDENYNRSQTLLTIITTITVISAVLLAIQIYFSKQQVSDSYIIWNSRFPIYYDAYTWMTQQPKRSTATSDLAAKTAYIYSPHPCMVIGHASDIVKSQLMPTCRR